MKGTKIKTLFIAFALTFVAIYAILPTLIVLTVLFLYIIKRTNRMNILKKLGFIFRSSANKALDQFISAQELSGQIKQDLEKAIFKLTDSLTEVNESRIRLTNSRDIYSNQLRSINSSIKNSERQGDDETSRRLAAKAIQYTNLIQGQTDAIAQITQVQDELKQKIRELHDTKSEVDVVAEVLQAEYETYSILNSVSAHGDSMVIKSDALEMLKSLAQRSKTEYQAKTETVQFTKQFEVTGTKTSSSSEEIDNYIKGLM